LPFTKTKPRLFSLFIACLPVVFTVVVYLGYTDAKRIYYQTGISAMEKKAETVLQVIQMMHLHVKAETMSVLEAEDQLREMLAGGVFSKGEEDGSRTIAGGENLFVFNSKGRLFIHPPLGEENLSDRSLPYRELVRKVLESGQTVVTHTWTVPGSAEGNMAARTKIAAISYFPQWDWYVAIVADEAAFYLPFQNVAYFLIMIVAVSYLITAILLSLTHRKEKAFLSSKQRTLRLAELNQSILKSLAVALEERDAYTSGHSQRVAYYMRVIGKKMGLDDETLDIIYTGGLLHDIGKIGIEDGILLKPGRLSEDEYEVIKSHPVRGEALLRRLYAQAAGEDEPRIQSILVITRHHHERYDGRGYPDQLEGEEIPLLARVSAVADSFDAMTSSRAYRKGLSFSKACDEIIRNAGTQFCPKVVEAFLQSVTEEVFLHAHNISRANELLAPIVQETDFFLGQRPIQG
jgi:hypothetical protein